jgi:hypothetical protein
MEKLLSSLRVPEAHVQDFVKFLEDLQGNPEPGKILIAGTPIATERRGRRAHKAIIFLVADGKSLLKKLWSRNPQGDLDVYGITRIRVAEVHARVGVPGLEGVRPEAIRRSHGDNYDVSNSYWFTLVLASSSERVSLLRVEVPITQKSAYMVIAGTFDLVGTMSAEWHDPLTNIYMKTLPVKPLRAP